MNYENEWREIFRHVYASYNIHDGMVNLYDYDCKTIKVAWSVDYSPLEFLQSFKVNVGQLPYINLHHLEECDVDIFIAEYLYPSEVLLDLGNILKGIATPKLQTNYEIVQEYVRRAGREGAAAPIASGWKDWFTNHNINISINK